MIEGGRAPVLDAQLSGGAVPNDVRLEGAGLRAIVVNGPNMAGKSVFMRQARASRVSRVAGEELRVKG